MDDDDFIDDSGVNPEDRYGSDNEARSPGAAPQVVDLCVWLSCMFVFVLIKSSRKLSLL